MPSTSTPSSSTKCPMVRSRSDEPSYFSQGPDLQDRDDRAESSSSPRTSVVGVTGRNSSSKPPSRIFKILGNHSSKASSSRSSNEDGNDDSEKIKSPSGRTGSLARRARKLFSIPETGSGQNRRWSSYLSRKTMNKRNRNMSEQHSMPPELIGSSPSRQRSRSDTNGLDQRSSVSNSGRPRRRSQRNRKLLEMGSEVQDDFEDKSRLNSSEHDRDNMFYYSRRYWRRIRKSLSPDGSELFSPHGNTSATHKTLISASSILGHLKADVDRHSGSSKSKSQDSSVDSNISRRFHISALRKVTTTVSTSSSVIRLVMGKPPVNTPNRDSMYSGADDIEYFKVDITDPDGPTYLPSEARRIATPPLPTEGPRKGRARGFFFDYDGFEDPDRRAQLLEAGLHACRKGPSSSEACSTDHWYRTKELPRKDQEDTRVSTWRWNIPAHLPDSLLCPMHENSISKGAHGFCVDHGRRKTLN